MSVLIPLNTEKTKYEGILDINNDLYRICIEKSKTYSRFTCDWNLQHKLKQHTKLLQKRLDQCNDVPQFWKEVKLLLESSLLNVTNEKLKWNAKFYDLVLTHLQDLGWNNVVDVVDDFLTIKLQAFDSADRKHTFDVLLSFNYPSEAPDVVATLPLPFKPLWTLDSNLRTIHNQFKSYLHQFERFWDEIEELKQNTWILEPESPNFAATSLQIALSKTSSIHLKIDLLNFNVTPECQFLGAEWSIAGVREKFQERYEDWNENLSLYQNLKNLLEIDFAEKQLSNSQNRSLRCGICYAFRLAMSIPDQICNNERCGQPFHHECLLEWIRSKPGAKQSFNVVFGECPYCTHAFKLDLVRL